MFLSSKLFSKDCYSSLATFRQRLSYNTPIPQLSFSGLASCASQRVFMFWKIPTENVRGGKMLLVHEAVRFKSPEAKSCLYHLLVK